MKETFIQTGRRGVDGETGNWVGKEDPWQSADYKTMATQNEIKQNIQGTNSEGKDTGKQMNVLEQKKEINIQLEQNEETIQKNEERLRNLWGQLL